MGLTSHLTSELWKREQLWAQSLAAKLREVGEIEKATTLENCHSRETFQHCLDCGHVLSFKNRCDRFYCSMCCQSLSFKRRRSVEAWARTISQPKHLVLTARNRTSISNNYVKWFKLGISKLRRTNACGDWRGGLYSLEVTNEGKGWHLHCHLLIDTDWLDMPRVSESWAKQVQQDFAICAVRDCREQTYLSEVTKYAVKGSQLASWSGPDAAGYIAAMTGVRQFGTFGTLFKDRALRQSIKESLEPEPCKCPKCEGKTLRWLDENEEEWLHETGKWPERKW
jgi:hypothetical protein